MLNFVSVWCEVLKVSPERATELTYGTTEYIWRERSESPPTHTHTLRKDNKKNSMPDDAPADGAFLAGLGRSVFFEACAVVFDELADGRGVSIPDLGTFTIDVRETFKGPGGRSVTTCQPMLVLSAAFTRLGVRPPAVKPAGTIPIRIIGWQELANRCYGAVDRDMAKRAVATTIASFVSDIAAMAVSTARSSACLDLGKCGKLRILRCRDSMRTHREPRFDASEALRAAVHRQRMVGPSHHVPTTTVTSGDMHDGISMPSAPDAQGGAGAKGGAAAAEDGAAIDISAQEGAEPSGSRPFITLAGLRHLTPDTPGWASCVAVPAPPPKPYGTSSAAAAPGQPGPPPPTRMPSALPLPSADTDEWAVRKLQTARAPAAPRVLSTSERLRRAESDMVNARVAQARSVAAREARAAVAQAREAPRGVDQLLSRLLRACATRAAVVDPALLQRKAELERRLRELERDIEVASVK